MSEATIRACYDAGDLDGAITKALETYGDELFGFLLGLARERSQAEDAFSATCERMWRGLPKFRWSSTLRVWAYRIARNEFIRTTRTVARARRTVALSDVSSIRGTIERIRSSTPVYQRTDVKDKFAAIRAELEPEDHMLLGLRIDRKLPWPEIATILGQHEEAPSAREVAALRKRFERLKAKLRERVQAS